MIASISEILYVYKRKNGAVGLSLKQKYCVSDNEGHSSTQDVCQLQLLTFEPII